MYTPTQYTYYAFINFVIVCSTVNAVYTELNVKRLIIIKSTRLLRELLFRYPTIFVLTVGRQNCRQRLKIRNSHKTRRPKSDLSGEKWYNKCMGE